MEKYNDEVILRICAALSTFFVLVVIVLVFVGENTEEASGMTIGKEKVEEKVEEKVTVQNIGIGDKIEEEIKVDEKDKLIIPLQNGVKEDEIHISHNLRDNVIDISFDVSEAGYDASQVRNNSPHASNLSYAYEDGSMKISVKTAGVVAYDKCVSKQTLYLDLYSPRDRYNAVVVVDPGHGEIDAGAINGDKYEKDICLSISKKLEKMFEKENVKLIMTRTYDEFVSVGARVDYSNIIQPDLFVSIHVNWYDEEAVNGINVLYNVKDTSERGSQWFATILSEEVAGKTGMKNRGAINGNDIHIVRNSTVPVALVEAGFMSNGNDFKVMSTEKGQKKIAQGIHDGIMKALKEMGK